jgi:ribosomal protein S27E
MTAKVTKAVLPRSRPARYITVVCAHCGEENTVDRAIMIPCSSCGSPAGAPCIDLRSKAKGTLTVLTKIHQVRVSDLAKMTLPEPADGDGDDDVAVAG